MRVREVEGMDPEISGVKKPKNEEERQRMLDAARALLAVDTTAIRQNPESVEATLERLREVHREVAGGRRSEPGVPWYRRHPVLLAGSLAGAAALVLGLVIFLVIGTGPPSDPLGTLLSEKGRISVVTEAGLVETAGEGGAIEVFSGSVVETRSDSRAILFLESGSEVRLDSSTSVGVENAGEDTLAADLYRGNAYHRIAEGDDYVLAVDGLQVSGSGCAFNTDLGPGEVTAITVFGTTTVVDEMEETVCRQGRKVVAERPFGTARLPVTDVLDVEISTPWFGWNLERDEEGGFDPGALADEPAYPAPDETELPAETPADETGERQRPVEPVTRQPSAALSGVPGPLENTLTWSLDSIPAGSEAVLLKSQSGACTYPEDQYAVLGPETSFADGNVRGGQAYCYRVAVVSSGTVVALSNQEDLAVPLWSDASLQATLEGGAARLAWSWRANFEVTQIALVRSGDGTAPEYPPASGGQRAWLLTPGASSLRDDSIQQGVTYRYRAFLLSGLIVAGGSNEGEVVAQPGRPE